MDAETFDQFMEKRFDDIRQMLVTKNSIEYAPKEKGVSRFHNFEVGAALNGKTIEETLWGFVTKHIVSVSDMVKDGPLEHSLPKWDEKIGDITVYMLLLHAMVTDAHNGNSPSAVDQALKVYHDHIQDLVEGRDLKEPDVSGDSPLGRAFSEAESDYEEQVAEAEREASKETVKGPVPNRITKVHDFAVHTEPVNEETRVIHHTEFGKRKTHDSLGVEYGCSVAEDSQDGEKETELGEIEFAGDVTPHIIQVENIFIGGDSPAEEHAKWLAAVTPPPDRNRLPRQV